MHFNLFTPTPKHREKQQTILNKTVHLFRHDNLGCKMSHQQSIIRQVQLLRRWD